MIDRDGHILEEYRKYLNYKGQPGAGDAFYRWMFNNRGQPHLCLEVEITPCDLAWRRFEEFPNDLALAQFDAADQKFVAAAVAAGTTTEILQALDHKWLQWSEPLSRHGVIVKFLCENDLKQVKQRRGLSD